MGLTHLHWRLILEFLPVEEAFGAARVCRNLCFAQEQLDARAYVKEIRPSTWLGWIYSEPMGQSFWRQLLREWHLCLKTSALQVAFVNGHGHVIAVEENTALASPPQRGDPFPIDWDDELYFCSIEPFDLEAIWWHFLEPQLFEWDEHGLEPVPGYKGDLSVPRRLLDETIAVLALNAAWFWLSYWIRQLQAILLLRDGRFLLIGTSEDQASIQSQVTVRACRVFVADSLGALVAYAQDDRSREILRTQLPGSSSLSATADFSLRRVKMPRVTVDRWSEFSRFQDIFGDWRKPYAPAKTPAKAPRPKGVLYSYRPTAAKPTEQQLRNGMRCRVRREGEALVWKRCRCEGWDIGPVAPELEREYVEQAWREDRRWRSVSVLSLRRDSYYSAVVSQVISPTVVDIQYTNPTEWEDLTTEKLIDLDVDIGRIRVLPSNSWYRSFLEVWVPFPGGHCGTRDFGPTSPQRTSRNGATARAPPESPGPDTECTDTESVGNPTDGSLKLAEVFADSLEAHIFRCKTLSEEKTMLEEERDAIEQLHEVRASPRGKDMALAKRLFLQLLRTPFWMKWTGPLQGESPARVRRVSPRAGVFFERLEIA